MSFRARALLISCFAIVALVFSRLGVWQLDRLRERRASNVSALAARSAPEVRIVGTTTANPSLEGRAVSAVGHYDHTHDVVLRGKAYDGSPGVEIVSPLVLEDGKIAVLVNRGFVPTPDAVTIQTDSVREPGKVRVRGTALAVPSGNGKPLERSGGTTWARLDLEALRGTMPYQLMPWYIRQSPDTALPRFPRRLEPLPLDDGPHLTYAIQWFAFAAMTIVFGVVILRTRSVNGKEKA